MINLDNLVTYQAIDNFTNEIVYESFYLSDVIDFIGEHLHFRINENVTSGYGPEVVEKDNCIMAGIRD